jgi:hypothetical protein
MRTNTILSVLLLAASAVLPGCSCLARDAETYRADTRTVLETRNDALKTCYDEALKADPAVSGDVVVTFKVEKKTGKLMDAAADPARTTAPSALSDCIVKSLDGLTLAPVDQRQGDATFSWSFKANPPKQL